MNKRGVAVAVFGIVLLVLIIAVMGFLSLKQQDTPTGNFAVIPAKEYGGSIRGVMAENSRAFPGRAIAIPPSQDCFSCSCPPLSFGITATNSDAAAQACADNCGGTVAFAHGNECSELERTRI